MTDAGNRASRDANVVWWAIALGHHVPELDAPVMSQLGPVAHTTLLGNSDRTVVEFAEALGDVVPVDHDHMLFASDGGVAVEQAAKSAFQ